MNMKKISVLIIALFTLTSSLVFGEKVETFEQAKILSAKSGIPILLEFVHED